MDFFFVCVYTLSKLNCFESHLFHCFGEEIDKIRSRWVRVRKSNRDIQTNKAVST